MARLDEARKLAIAERLRGLRDRDPSVKQPHVADATGVSLRTVQLWEAGDSTPEWEHAEALAKFYAVDVDWMMGRTEAEKHGPTPEAPGAGDPQLASLVERLGVIERKLDELLAVTLGDATEVARRAAEAARRAAANSSRSILETSRRLAAQGSEGSSCVIARSKLSHTGPSARARAASMPSPPPGSPARIGCCMRPTLRLPVAVGPAPRSAGGGRAADQPSCQRERMR